jgi:phosphomannomutase
VLIATHSGLRGRPGSELTEELVDRTSGRLVAHLRAAGLPPTVAVARDERDTSAGLADDVCRALVRRGTDVLELGVVSTPGAKVAARELGVGGLVVVTGSHLAEDLNGLKLVAAPSWAPLDVRRMPEPAAAGAGEGSRRADPRAPELHARAACAAVDAEAIRAAAPAVGLIGGAGESAALALEALGCRTTALGDGPVALTLHLDADADRVHLGDESGTELDSELTLALAVAAREPELVVRSSDTSRAVDELQGRRGARTVVVPPGELHLVEALPDDAGAALAGEGNGGVIVPAAGPGRDGLAAGLLALELVVRSGRTLSELVAELPRLFRHRSQLRCEESGEAARRLTSAAGALGLPSPGDPEVGVAVERAGSWGLIRRSATEPLLKLTTEAPTQRAASALHRELEAALA